MYELRVYDLVLGKKEQWEHRIIQGLPERCKLSEPVGVWFTEFGPVNTGMIILILQSTPDTIHLQHVNRKSKIQCFGRLWMAFFPTF